MGYPPDALCRLTVLQAAASLNMQSKFMCTVDDTTRGGFCDDKTNLGFDINTGNPSIQLSWENPIPPVSSLYAEIS